MPKCSTAVKVIVSLLYCKSVRVNLEFKLLNVQYIRQNLTQLKFHEGEL